jgi:hypothetical protein
MAYTPAVSLLTLRSLRATSDQQATKPGPRGRPRAQQPRAATPGVSAHSGES